MGTTTTYGWRSPNLGDPADGPGAILTGLQDAEDTVKDATRISYTPTWASDGASQPSGASIRVGYYRVDNGVCHLTIRLVGGASVSGGTGTLYLHAPLAPSAAIDRQFLPLSFVANTAGGGVYTGFAHIIGSVGTRLHIYLPASASDTRLDAWRNAPAGGAPGAGIPLVSGGYGMVNGSELILSGSYFV